MPTTITIKALTFTSPVLTKQTWLRILMGTNSFTTSPTIMVMATPTKAMVTPPLTPTLRRKRIMSIVRTS